MYRIFAYRLFHPAYCSTRIASALITLFGCAVPIFYHLLHINMRETNDMYDQHRRDNSMNTLLISPRVLLSCDRISNSSLLSSSFGRVIRLLDPFFRYKQYFSSYARQTHASGWLDVVRIGSEIPFVRNNQFSFRYDCSISRVIFD